MEKTQDHQDLRETLACLVHQESQALLGNLVLVVSQELQENLESEGLWERQVSLDLKALQVYLVDLEKMEFPAMRDQLADLVIEVPKERGVILGSLEREVFRARGEGLEKEGLMAFLVRKDILVHLKGYRDTPCWKRYQQQCWLLMVIKVPQALLEMMGPQVPLENQDPQALKAIGDRKEREVK
ncbi:uncharacterized [Tachysurus ichikawai]